MRAVPGIGNIVRDLVRARAPHGELTDDAPLGTHGLGLDSISMAELLLDCEDRFGVDATPLLEREPLTLGALIAHVQMQVEQETPA
jgi:acyl carrier protein